MAEASSKSVKSQLPFELVYQVSALIVAIILQIFYNYIVSKVDGLVNAMEDSTISFIDILAKNK